MMEGSGNWIFKLVECFILCLFILVRSTCGQEGFVSLACCDDSNFTDKNTAINWRTDDSWFPDRKGCRSEVREGLSNHEGYVKARIFKIDSGKRCYKLTTIAEQEYLVRATFLFGDSLSTSLDTSFDVLVGVTLIGRVSSSEHLEVEGIFRATKDRIDFCLAKVKGDPYISKLELRPLKNLNYLQGLSPSVLKLVSRIDVGSEGGDIRYPGDESDRIWKPLANSSTPPVSNFSSFSNKANNVTAPLLVLQTALNHSERLEFHEDLDKNNYEYRVLLYFLELDGNVKSKERVFDIYINSEKIRHNFDILSNGSNYKEVVSDVKANGSLNLTFIKASGNFGPICNAYEILQVHPWVQETNQKDVEVILSVRNEVLVSNQANELLESWSGDPCLPNPWHGLDCAPYNGSTTITSLNLSSSKLQGSIPSSITELADVKKLNLSYNHFSGSIPEFPASSMLISGDIRHNDLAGPLPESLTSLPHLESLYFGCNRHLDKVLQLGFNSTRLLTDSGRCDSEGPTRKPGIIIGSISCGLFLFTVIVGIIFVCIYTRRLRPRGRFDGKGQKMVENVLIFPPSKDEISIRSISVVMFTLEYIEAATKKYKTLIGGGGFGSVYRGTLPDGKEVAVKVRSATSTQGTREFDNELNMLSAIQHQNLVPLLGYCCEYDQQILVYPFMSNGSLQDQLYGEAAKRKTLDWPTRLSIALGAARGLTYLHKFAGRCIIHRDVKSSNILLDHTMCAKVADFGFSKYAPQEGDSVASLEIRGTAGYLDPEYYTTQQLSTKSDVFSFGVVLLEIVSGREPFNMQRPHKEWSLVEWAKPYIRESRNIDEIVDPSLKGGYHAEAMWRVVEAALLCIETSAASRPSMATIVRELEDALIIENNASEYMKSIDSQGASNSNGFSIVIDKRIALPPISTPSEPASNMTYGPSLPQPR